MPLTGGIEGRTRSPVDALFLVTDLTGPGNIAERGLWCAQVPWQSKSTLFDPNFDSTSVKPFERRGTHRQLAFVIVNARIHGNKCRLFIYLGPFPARYPAYFSPKWTSRNHADNR